MATSLADDKVLTTLHDIGEVLSQGLERDAMLALIIDSVISATGAERAVLLLDEPGRGLEVQVARNFRKEDLKEPGFAASKTVIDFVLATGTSQLIDDALTDNRTAASESVAAQKLRSIVCVPIGTPDDTVGVLYLDHPGRAAHFGPNELKLLEVIVHQAAVPLQGDRLHQQARTQLQAVDSLTAFRDTIMDGLSTAVVSLDGQGRVLGLNPAGRELFQVSGENGASGSYKTVLGEALAAQLLEAFKAAVGGRATPAAQIEATIGSTRRSLVCSVSAVRDSAGKTIGIVLLVDDQTPRVQAERARARVEAEHKRVLEVFSTYVPEAVVQQVLRNPNETGQGRAAVTERELSVVFADIRGYTTFSERSTPDRLLVTLTRYLTVATNCIIEQNGTLDKFMGDGVMAIFNAPQDVPDHPLAAVRAAWAMQRRAAKFMEGVSFGVGVNTGPAFVGNIGTDKIRNYSCVGDVVNVASRLQGHAEGGNIVITRATYNRVKDHVRARALGPIQVKGRAMPVEAIEVLAVHGEMDS
jgi:adenylate cyclase